MMGGSVGESTGTRAPNTDRGQRRILVLTTTLPAVPGDGTPEFVLSLAREMSTDYDITILAPRVRGVPISQQFGRLRVVRFPYFPRRWEGLADGAILPNLRAARWRLIEVPFLLAAMMVCSFIHVLREKPALVHAHWIVPGGLVAMLVKAVTGTKYILTVHGSDVYGLRGAAYVFLRDRIVAAASAVLPVSNHLATSLQLAPDACTVIPMGVDRRDLPARIAHERYATSKLLFIGRLAEQKGVDVLLRALARVADVHLTVVGEGPERSSLEALALRLDVAERVAFLGHQPREGVIRLLADASVLVIPSRASAHGDREGTPVVLAEGIAMGVPIIASSIGGLAERIDHGVTGLLVEPGNVNDLAEALECAVRDPEGMLRFAEKARATLLPGLDMRTTASRYVEVVRGIVCR